MTRETVIIIIKALLTVVGSWLIGQNFIGQPIDQNMLEIIGGVIMSGVSIFWSIRDKSYTIESLQAFIRQVVLFVGGLLIAANKLTPDRLEGILGLMLAVIPIVQSYTSKRKAQKLQEGEISAQNLSSIPNNERSA
jgi:hypothetical protein